MHELFFGQAAIDDRDEILKLYRSQLGTPMCFWSEEYPGENEIDYDYSREALFVVKDKDGVIKGSISIDLDENVEKLDIWTSDGKKTAELSRLAVSKDIQNQGVARLLMKEVFEVLRQRGYERVHIIVNKDNLKALNSYKKLDYTEVGNVWLYNQSYIGFEKEL